MSVTDGVWPIRRSSGSPRSARRARPTAGGRRRQQRHGVGVERLAGRQQGHPAAGAVEQRHTQLALQRAHRHAQSLLRQVQPGRGAGHAAFLGDGDEVGDLAQIEPHLAHPLDPPLDRAQLTGPKGMPRRAASRRAPAARRRRENLQEEFPGPCRSGGVPFVVMLDGDPAAPPTTGATMKYMLLINSAADRPTPPTPRAPRRGLDALRQGGQGRRGLGLGASRWRTWSPPRRSGSRNDGERTVTDGPFAETREVLGGFYVDRRAGPGRRARLGGPLPRLAAAAGRSRCGRSPTSAG